MKIAEESFTPHAVAEVNESDMIRKTEEYLKFMNSRRTVRHFSDKTVPLPVIENLLKTAGTAPSGANKQPWTFCVISNKELKRKIRKGAEDEDFLSYSGKSNPQLLKDVEPFGTSHTKEFIEVCPYIIVVFKRIYEVDGKGTRHNNYYVNESVGIAVGFLLAAIHKAGLVALTHSPSPMNFMQELLGRPENEQPFLLIATGYPAENVKVPNIARKPLDEVSVFYH